LSSDVYYGLDSYLQLEGFAFRLLPVKHDKNKLEVTNSDVMFNNLMNKMEYSSFTKAKYLDPESQNAARLTWETFNTLALNLRQENKIVKSRDLMKKALHDLPSRNYTVADTVTKYRTAGNLYSLNEISGANEQVRSAVEFLKSELSYYASLDEKDQALANSDITQVLSILNAFKGLAEFNDQPAIAKDIIHIFDAAKERLHFSLPG
jgi:hypothetical protein